MFTVLFALVVLFALTGSSRAIPAFSRQYGTSCSTCHVDFPKLNDFIARLIRPVLGYLRPDPKEDLKFDGIGFSTTVSVTGKNQPASGSEAVEFFFPLTALRCYESYDCTGQPLIAAGTVLINGERVSLDLQIAEGSAR
jgi:hypothetical protein